jgi:hypothetical protein
LLSFRRDPVLSDQILDDFERVHQLDASQHRSASIFCESRFASFKLANQPGRSIAKLRNPRDLTLSFQRGFAQAAGGKVGEVLTYRNTFGGRRLSFETLP